MIGALTKSSRFYVEESRDWSATLSSDSAESESARDPESLWEDVSRGTEEEFKRFVDDGQVRMRICLDIDDEIDDLSERAGRSVRLLAQLRDDFLDGKFGDFRYAEFLKAADHSMKDELARPAPIAADLRDLVREQASACRRRVDRFDDVRLLPSSDSRVTRWWWRGLTTRAAKLQREEPRVASEHLRVRDFVPQKGQPHQTCDQTRLLVEALDLHNAGEFPDEARARGWLKRAFQSRVTDAKRRLGAMKRAPRGVPYGLLLPNAAGDGSDYELEHAGARYLRRANEKTAAALELRVILTDPNVVRRRKRLFSALHNWPELWQSTYANPESKAADAELTAAFEAAFDEYVGAGDAKPREAARTIRRYRLRDGLTWRQVTEIMGAKTHQVVQGKRNRSVSWHRENGWIMGGMG